MGERIYFATSNWKDKPSKPSCYSQGEWDARNSSKFNGVPFAGGFAVDPENPTVWAYDATEYNNYKNALLAINTPPVQDPNDRENPWCGVGCQLDILFGSLPNLELKPFTVPCDKLEMKVWNGSTYYERVGANKSFEWKGWYDQHDYGTSAGVPDIKMPSAITEAYVPVCGPGTHIQEVTKDFLMKIIWLVSEFDINCLGVSSSVQLNITKDFNNWNGSLIGSFTSTAGVTVTASNKNLNNPPGTTGKESDILKLQWTDTPQRGYTGEDGSSASLWVYRDYNIEPDPDTGKCSTLSDYQQNAAAGTGNGNVSVQQASISPSNGSYEYCGSLTVNSNLSGSINIKLKPSSDDRHRYVYFVTDATSGQEKIYFDPTGLFEFNVNGYTLAPGDALAPFTLTVDILGTNFTIPVMGPENGTFGGVTRQFSPGTVSINAKKYYPYANSKGEEVYNEDTGAQLKDPVS